MCITKAGVGLATVMLLLAGSVCKASDYTPGPVQAGDQATTQAPAASAPATLPAPKDIDRATTLPAPKATSDGAAAPAPAQAAPPIAVAADPAGAPGCCPRAPRSCCERLHHFCEWLTYRRLDHCCGYCCPKCYPCCPPQLYAFFLCYNGPGGAPGCLRPGCAGCAAPAPAAAVPAPDSVNSTPAFADQPVTEAAAAASK